MALEATFRRLSMVLCRLHDAFNALQVTVGDKPANDEMALADGLENKVLDIMGTLHEIRKVAQEAQAAVMHPMDLDSARHSLAACQERFHRVEQQFAFDLVSYENLTEVARVGRKRRGWLPWANSIRQGIEQCRQPLAETSLALAACWQELAERWGTMNISIKAMNVGQKITASKPKIEDLEVEGAT